MLRTAFYIILACLLLPSAWAARVTPQPIIRQMADGYGFVSAEVFQYVVQPERGGVRKYRVTFKVQEIYAQPLTGKQFTFKPGKVVILWITVGYGAMYEPLNPNARDFEKGRKYVLPIRYNKELAIHEHAPGAGAFKPVPAFTQTMKQRIRATRQLASRPKAERLKACHELIAQKSEDIFMRREGLYEVHALNDASSHAFLTKFWAKEIEEQSDAYAMDLDYYSRRMMGETFETSVARRDFWLGRYLESMQELSEADRTAEAMRRNNLFSGLLVEIGRHHPKVITRRLLPVFRQKGWPDGYQVATLRVLLNLHRVLEDLPAHWEPALQLITRELKAKVSGPEQAFLSGVLSWAASPANKWEKRTFVLEETQGDKK